jgi:hypothetical protein
MNTPGFTGDTSAYKSSRSYNAAILANGGASGVLPAVAIGLQPVAPNGSGGGVICFGLCVLICEFVGESNCLRRCADICSGKVVVALP